MTEMERATLAMEVAEDTGLPLADVVAMSDAELEDLSWHCDEFGPEDVIEYDDTPDEYLADLNDEFRDEINEARMGRWHRESMDAERRERYAR